MRKPLKAPLLLGELLKDALKKAAEPDSDPLVRIQARWVHWVGDTLGAKTRPVKLLGKRLLVAVAASAWANELDLQKSQVLDAVQKDCPEISVEDLRYQIETRPSVSI